MRNINDEVIFSKLEFYKKFSLVIFLQQMIDDTEKGVKVQAIFLRNSHDFVRLMSNAHAYIFPLIFLIIFHAKGT